MLVPTVTESTGQVDGRRASGWKRELFTRSATFVASKLVVALLQEVANDLFLLTGR